MVTVHNRQSRIAHHWRTLAACGFILVTAAIVRFHHLGAEDFWLDELHSMVASAGHRKEWESVPHGVILKDVPRYTDLTADTTIGAVWKTMAEDIHPPLYFVGLNVWRRWFGDGEAATRSLSVVASILSIIPFALIVRRGCPPRSDVPSITPFAAALVGALAFSHIHLSQNARPYALGMFFVTFSAWLLVEWEARWAAWSMKWRIVAGVTYGTCALLAMLTHYFAGLALLTQAVYALFSLHGPSLRAWGVTVIAAAAGWLLLSGHVFLEQWDLITGQEWLLESGDDHFLRVAMRLADLPMRLLFAHEPFTFSVFRSVGGAGLIIGALWLLFSRSRTMKGRLGLVDQCNPRIDRLFALWFLVPVLAFLTIDLFARHQMLSHIRYPVVALPGLIGLVVLAAGRLPTLGRRTALVVFLAWTAITLQLPTISNPHARKAAGLIADEARPGDLIIYDAIDWPRFSASSLWIEVSYYLPASAGSLPFAMLREPPESEFVASLREFDRVIVVSPRVEGDPNPWPEGLELTRKTGYIRQIGPIYLFERRHP